MDSSKRGCHIQVNVHVHADTHLSGILYLMFVYVKIILLGALTDLQK
jgi:hypothetical protein